MPAALLERPDIAARAATPGAKTDAAPLRVRILSSYAEAEPFWRPLAAEGHATPYQSFAFAEAYARHVDAPAGRDPLIVLIADGAGAPLLLAPLAIHRMGPLRVARFTGGKHANFNMPVCAPAAASLDGARLADALRRAGRAAGVDLFAFASQPLEWEGFANPFAALGGRPSPSAGYKLALAADAESLLKDRLSKDARKKLRQKEGKLAQTGPLAYVRPEEPEAIRAALAAFLRLKSARFQTQGIADPFDGPDIRAFLDEIAAGLDPGRRALELHVLRAGERIVAIYGGLADSQRFCGLFTAFDADPEIARASPGDILLMKIIADACARGLQTFDLGVGEARYKAQVCDRSEPLFDSVLAVSAQGRLAGAALASLTAAKRWAKQSPAATRLITALRRAKAGARG